MCFVASAWPPLSRHLIQSETAVCRRQNVKVNPKSDHLSFLCRDMDLVRAALQDNNIEFVEQNVKEDGIEQVCFRFSLSK